MKKSKLFILGLILIMSSCSYDPIEENKATDCSIEDKVNSREIAKALILGNWNWVKTTYTRRGTGTTTETPYSTNKKLTYKFTSNKVQIEYNNNLIEELYEIMFLGEGTNTMDEVLIIRFFKLTGEFQGTSILFLNPYGTCLTLVNSYNDAGGDLTFRRVD